MPLTEEEMMDRAGSEMLQPCGLPLETIARMQLASGTPAGVVAQNTLLRNGWSKEKTRAFMAAEGHPVSFAGDLAGPCFPGR